MEARIQKAPQGSIRFIERNGSIQFYLRTDPKDKSGKYMGKGENAKIKIYLQKAYDKKVLKNINREIGILEKLLKQSASYPQEIQDIYSAMPSKVQDYINPLDMADMDYARKWQEILFEGKNMPEDKNFKTNRGEYVRSKSELTIANTLYRSGVPYKYECPLQLKNGVIIHPDFTVLNVRERKIYYWEHRGMMDSPDYARGAVLRNKNYLKSHIILGKNLIITEETSVNPLSTAEIDAVLREYLI